MADNPYWDPSELDLSDSSSSERESIEDLEDLVDVDKYEQMALQAAIQQSYKETKENKENNKENSEMTKKEDKPTTLPVRNLTAQQIEEGERWRERELYGPPTPPRRRQQVVAKKSSDEPLATTVATASGTNNAQHRTSAGKHPQKAAVTADHPKADLSNAADSNGADAKPPVKVRSAVADAVAYYKQTTSNPSFADAGPAAFDMAPSGRSDYENLRDALKLMEQEMKSGKTAVPGGFPAPDQSPPAANNGFQNTSSYAGQGSDAAWVLQTRDLPRPTVNNGPASSNAHRGFDPTEVPRPNHKFRMRVIRAALKDPRSRLSIAVREARRARRDKKRQQSRGESSAGPQPGPEQAEPPQTKTRHD